jgi:hypothetical protein
MSEENMDSNMDYTDESDEDEFQDYYQGEMREQFLVPLLVCLAHFFNFEYGRRIQDGLRLTEPMAITCIPTTHKETYDTLLPFWASLVSRKPHNLQPHGPPVKVSISLSV